MHGQEDPLEPKLKRLCLDTIRLFNKVAPVRTADMKEPQIKKRPKIH
jgi:hypothetical protein